jgi:hypothetical protein
VAEVLAMVAFLEWQQTLDRGHCFERGVAVDEVRVVVDHGAIEEKKQGSERPRRASSSARFMIFGPFHKLPITALGVAIIENGALAHAPFLV